MQKHDRILAIDDNPINLTVLRALLKHYTLETATSGDQAIEIASDFRPDLVLLDVLMPGIDGFSTCQKLRAMPCLRHTKIIMVSAKCGINERLKGYEYGADDYVVKPFDSDELLAKIKVYLKLKSAEEIEEIRNRTIEVLQHSNRTPLNNIISYAEMLTSPDALDDEFRELAPQVILRHARRLQRLLEKGELLAKLKTEQLEFDFAEHDLCQFVRRVISQLEPALLKFDVQLESDMPEKLDVIFDQETMDFAIRSLLDNGVRFSKPGGRVKIELKRHEDSLTLAVSDQGVGVLEGLIPHIFEPFGNPDSPLYNQGDGLSLSIVEQIAWGHGGKVAVRSQPGHGATFTLTLPVS
ncbi:MAG: hybrid sensor histidine kinase/response regulator [Phycisphaera sp. RhM]|nr:hybrid sensor histidine kinase/response regulator [Phycisphaera sp. RhM]